MKGKRIPLFKRVGVVTKIAPEISAPASTGGWSTALGKRPSDPAAPPKPILMKKTKTLAHRPTRREAPFVDTPIVSGVSSKRKESDSAPKVTAGYSATYLNLPYTLPSGYEVTEKSKLGMALDAFHVTHPLLLEGIRKPYEEFIDPLELQGLITTHLVKSHVLARRVDRLEVDLGLSLEGERASQLKVLELEKENEDLLWNQETAYKEKKIATQQALAEIAKCKDLEAQNVKLEGEKFDLTLKLSRLELSLSQEKKRAKEAEQKALVAQESASQAVEEYRSSEAFCEELGEETAYCLCHFVKTFKGINPSLAAHYLEFISGYPPTGFPPWILMLLCLLWKVVKPAPSPRLKICLRLDLVHQSPLL
ncbi:hypothetical protein LIER_17246 [Lithospermum erythrorhizon]|uniref:Uncharacterized protein n=1 Tax=Lithospermum erythrorhizon TaxID=34254 RepID=A0AAV3QF15_LITER